MHNVNTSLPPVFRVSNTQGDCQCGILVPSAQITYPATPGSPISGILESSTHLNTERSEGQRGSDFLQCKVVKGGIILNPIYLYLSLLIQNISEFENLKITHF